MWAPAWLAAPRAIVSVMFAVLPAVRRPERPRNGDPARSRDGLAAHATPLVPHWPHARGSSAHPGRWRGDRGPAGAPRGRRALAPERRLGDGGRGPVGAARGPGPRCRDAVV